MIRIVCTAMALLAQSTPDIMPAAPPEGDWARGDGKARVHIAPCEDRSADLCAINTWIRSDVHDEKTGDRLVMTLKPAGSSVWKGKAFDPQRHLTYRLTLRTHDGAMTTSGCVLGGLVCKSMSWKRLD